MAAKESNGWPSGWRRVNLRRRKALPSNGKPNEDRVDVWSESDEKNSARVNLGEMMPVRQRRVAKSCNRAERDGQARATSTEEEAAERRDAC